MPEIITHAHVRFVDDKVMATVPRSSIKRFSPKHCEDFDKEKYYAVLWVEETKDTDDQSPAVAAYYKANILLLGTSEEDINTKLKASRLKFPAKRPLPDKTEDISGRGSEVGDTGVNKNLKKLRSAAKKDTNLKILNEKMSKLKSQKLEIGSSSEEEKFDDNDDGSDKDGSPIKNESDKRNKTLSKHEVCDERYTTLSKKYSELMVRVGNLEAEVKRARNANPHQEEFSMKTNNVNRQLFSEQEQTSGQRGLRSSTETFVADGEGSENQISNLDRYATFSTIKDNIKVKRVHLGSGISIDEDAWAMIEVRGEDSKFVEELATAVWTRSTLVNRSLDGKAAGRLPGQGIGKALTPSKMKVVRKCYEDRLIKKEYEGEPLLKELKRMNSFLTELINDFIKRELKALKAQAGDNSKMEAEVDAEIHGAGKATA